MFLSPQYLAEARVGSGYVSIAVHTQWAEVRKEIGEGAGTTTTLQEIWQATGKLAGTAHLIPPSSH